MIDLSNVGKKQTQFLKRAYDQKKLAHSYLFVDSDEARALNTAYWLACLFNCTGENKPDGSCQNCRQILSGNHPDVLLVAPDGKQTLGIDQIRPLKEELAKSPVESTRRFFFINEAQKLTLAAANGLLNLLEEPVAPVVTILITNNSDQILPTVRSRTQIINFDNGERASGRTADLLENGFSKAEIEELGNLDKWNQAIKYFYQEMLEHNSLALVSAHKLAADAKLVSEQGYILLQLKLLAEQDLRNPAKRIMAATMLKNLIEIDKIRLSNVNIQNALYYIDLKRNYVFRMNPYSKLKKIEETTENMTKTIASLENDILETLKENTELKVENQLLHEKLDKLTANQPAPETKTQSGLESLKKIYDSGYHICNMYYGSHRDPSADCMFCLDILDNFGEKKGKKKDGR